MEQWHLTSLLGMSSEIQILLSLQCISFSIQDKYQDWTTRNILFLLSRITSLQSFAICWLIRTELFKAKKSVTSYIILKWSLQEMWFLTLARSSREMSIHAYLLLFSIQYPIQEAKVSFICSAQKISCFLNVPMDRKIVPPSLLV